jgi:tRNA(fMet)-specific endonuclease VapC
VALIFDTNVAINLRDGDPVLAERVRRLDGAILFSVLTRVEPGGGVYRDPADVPARRARLDAMLSAIQTLAFDDAAADAYRAIVERIGYSCRKLLDRMIAAQALVHRATVVTMTPDDFADIPGLDVLPW